MKKLRTAVYQTVNKISKVVATKRFVGFSNQKIIQKIGTTGKGTKYILPYIGLVKGL